MLFRMKSLETAVKLLESTDIQIRLISDQLKLISQKPLNIRNFAVADAINLHEDLKVQFMFMLADTCTSKCFSHLQLAYIFQR